MKILAIGNSFSDDAFRYISKIAKADGLYFKTVNLFIGGCSLYRHYSNMMGDKRVYELQYGGEGTGFSVSVREALLSDEWDCVSIQQVSHLAPDFCSFNPYLEYMAGEIRKYCPKAKLLIHQTWAYEDGSDRLTKELGYKNRKEMLSCIKASYDNAKKLVSADEIIRSGELFDKLLDSGIKSVHRDTFHASLGLGRYALGLLWYHVLTGRSVSENSFSDFDEEINPSDIATVKKIVEQF